MATRRDDLNSSMREERRLISEKSHSNAHMAKISPRQVAAQEKAQKRMVALQESRPMNESSSSLTKTEPMDETEQEPTQSVFQCRHCSKSFATRQGLGGHASKKHPGLSLTYQAKVTRRHQRKNDRLVLNIAKDLLSGMSGKDGDTLDPLTAKLFKR